MQKSASSENCVYWAQSRHLPDKIERATAWETFTAVDSCKVQVEEIRKI